MGRTDPEVGIDDFKMLIVDDERSMRSALTRALRCQDCDITVAADGAEAVAILEQQLPVESSAAIVDPCMPRMDGLESLVEIKRRSSATQVLILAGKGTVADVVQAMRLNMQTTLLRVLQEREVRPVGGEAVFPVDASDTQVKGIPYAIPVIFLSELSESYQKVSALDAGAEDYIITKPFDPNELRARVWSQLRKRRQQRELLAQDRAGGRQLWSTLNRVQETARTCGAPLLDLDTNLEPAGLVRRPELQRELLSRAKKDMGQITRSLMRITDGLATKGNH